MPVDVSSLGKALDAIRKNYGEESVRYASNYPEIQKIPTGISALDAASGGGFPLGRWVHAFGGYSSGKTLTCFHLIAQAQKLGYTCAYYDLENQFNKEWASSIGIDIDNLLVLDGPVIEETAEKLEALLGSINVHVIDSVGVGVSQDELAARADEWRPGISARAWGKLIRRTNKAFDKHENMVILINQTREAFGKMFTSEVPTGGRAIEHVSSLSLHFRRSSFLYKDAKGNLAPDGARKDGSENISPSGVELVVKVTKSRVHDPQDEARFRLEYGSGGQFDEVWTLVRSLIFNGIVTRSGSWYMLPDGDKVQGENGLRIAIQEKKELKELARNAML